MGLPVALPLENDIEEHLAEAVKDAVAVLLPTLLLCEVGRNHREQLVLVAIFQQVNNRRANIAEDYLLVRLYAQIVKGDAVVSAYGVEIVRPLHVACDVLCLEYPHACVLTCQAG